MNDFLRYVMRVMTLADLIELILFLAVVGLLSWWLA